MSKKIISLMVVVCMLCLSACMTAETNSNPHNTPSESQTHTTSNTDDNSSNEENSQVSSNTEGSKGNDTPQTQTPTNPQKPTNTTNQGEHTHSYSNATCTSPKKCACGATAGTALGHQFTSATCTSPQICNRCGTANGNALGHNYSEANCHSPKTCTVCGHTAGSALEHNYVNNKCSRCGKTDPDSLPVGLDKLVVVDCKSDYSSRYRFDAGGMTDSFGNSYVGYHYFSADSVNMYAIYNLGNAYSDLSLDIVAMDSIHSSVESTIEIYVDNVLMFTKSKFTRTSGKVHVDVDVSNGELLEIRVIRTACSGDQYARVAIVNAQLTK